jgi:acetyltransferase-like isoleucine patch superfamily enzyme
MRKFCSNNRGHLVSKGIIFGDRCSVGRFSIIRASGSPDFISPGSRVGDHVSFGPYSNVGCGFGLNIGDDCIFGPYVSIHPEVHKFSDPITPIRTQGLSGQGITIEPNCWFGAKVCVLDSTVVGAGCVIAAGAILAGGTLERDSIFAGIPARRLKRRF